MFELKRIIIEKYLPSWCRVELIDENRKLREKIEKQADEIRELNAYIDGMHDAIRYRQTFIMNGRSSNA